MRREIATCRRSRAAFQNTRPPRSCSDKFLPAPALDRRPEWPSRTAQLLDAVRVLPPGRAAPVGITLRRCSLLQPDSSIWNLRE